jgi:hypothetical protein
MAQKFTVDPRLLAAVSGGKVEEEDNDASSVEDEEEEKEKDEEIIPITEVERKQIDKKKLLEKRAAEYEKEQEKARLAAESGDGCLMCGS